ncbi:MAG: chemotaxis signal transduction protein [Herbinix sp.]|jgi:purine-binding chemotaxis protein CheW|nr:chemotaxis signal transduction protein [Herbinix sp.]
MSQIVIQEEFEQEEDTQKGKYLTFSMGNETYGMEIRYVTEIIGIQPITEVPELPNYIRGIINLRGKIIAVMDVRLRFKKEYLEYNDRTCIVVIDTKDMLIGLIVDSVSEVLAISEDEIVAPPDINKNSQKYIKAIGKTGSEVKLLLDCEKLLSDNEIVGLSNVG